jgi:DUF4097 and DUF4098 domain-containing protein YvlB
MNRLLVPFSSLLVFLFLFSVQAIAVTLEETVKKTIEIDDQEVLFLENKNGKIEISSWNNSAVEIIAHKKVNARSRAKAEEILENVKISIEESKKSIDIETIYPKFSDDFDGIFSWLFRGGNSGVSVRYEVKVPRQFDLNIHSTNGSIYADKCSGRMRLETTNGNIKASQIRGMTRCRTTNGSLKIEFDEVFGNDEMSFSSTNGSVKLYLPSDIDANIQAKTTNGSIKCDLPMQEMYMKKKTFMKGMINKGGQLISVKTTNGSIHIYDN